MKITKSHLRKIIQEEYRSARAVNVSDPVRAVGGAGHPRLEEWAFKLMNELTPEIPALQDMPEKKMDGAVKRIADGAWKGLMDAISLAPDSHLEEAPSDADAGVDQLQYLSELLIKLEEADKIFDTHEFKLALHNAGEPNKWQHLANNLRPLLKDVHKTMEILKKDN